MSKQYFPAIEPDHYVEHGISYDARGSLAIHLVQHWGMVQGLRGEEDSTGRAALDLMPVEEVVERACAMAEQLYAALEQRGWIREPIATIEEKWAAAGHLERLKSDVQYSRHDALGMPHDPKVIAKTKEIRARG